MGYVLNFQIKRDSGCERKKKPDSDEHGLEARYSGGEVRRLLSLARAIRRGFEELSIIPWNSFFRLILGKDWYVKLRKYPELDWIRHLQVRLSSRYYVRRVGDLVQTRTPYGIMFQPIDSLLINEEIYSAQVYDRFYEIRENDIVIDVGAHVGVFTLKTAKRAKTVVAIEPHPFNYKLLLMNIALNRLGNVIPVNLALSDIDGVTKLYIGKSSASHTIKEELRDAHSCTKYIEVEVKTLDRLMDELKLSKVSFIKIDAEGAELNILKGAERVLEENDVFLAVEAHHTPTEAREITMYLRRKHFVVFSYAPHGAPYIYAFKPSMSPRIHLA